MAPLRRSTVLAACLASASACVAYDRAFYGTLVDGASEATTADANDVSDRVDVIATDGADGLANDAPLGEALDATDQHATDATDASDVFDARDASPETTDVALIDAPTDRAEVVTNDAVDLVVADTCVCAGSQQCCNGLCVDLGSSVDNCGACGNVCSFANASATCASSQCVLGTCSPGFADCNRVASDGCETPLDTPSNCGGCGVVCGAPNASGTCTGGTCGFVCNAGWGDCDGIPDNGCESNLTVSPSRCGACTTACATGQTCSSGACAAPSGNTFGVGGVENANCLITNASSIGSLDTPGGGVGTVGGIVASGTSGTSVYGMPDLLATSGSSTSVTWILSDYATSLAYTLGNAGTPLPTTGGAATELLQLASNTGLPTTTAIALTSAIMVPAGSGVFSGLGRVAILNGAHAYVIELPTGAVIDEGAVTLPAHNGPSGVPFSGILEFSVTSGFEVFFVASATTLARIALSTGIAVTATLPINLGTTHHMGYLVDSGRLYFATSGTFALSQYGTTVWYCDAEWGGFGGSCFGTAISCPSVIATGDCAFLQTEDLNCGSCGHNCASGTYCLNGNCFAHCPTGETLCNNSCVDTNSDASNCGSCGHICATGTRCNSGVCG